MPKRSPTVTRQSNVPRNSQDPTKGAVSAWDFQDRISMNLYGRSGTGKTTLWATFPGPILAIICSGGLKPGELKSINTPENRKKINPVVARSSEEVTALIRQGNDYATVVVDHGTGLQDLKLKEILNLDELPAQLSWGLATQQQYGQLALQMKETFRAILNLDANVVIVCQERDFNTGDSDNTLLQPYVASALSPSVVGWLNPAVDIVCQTFVRNQVVEREQTIAGKTVKTKSETGKVEWCLRTYPSATYASKFRVPKGTELPDCIIDPSYDKIVALTNGRPSR